MPRTGSIRGSLELYPRQLGLRSSVRYLSRTSQTCMAARSPLMTNNQIGDHIAVVNGKQGGGHAGDLLTQLPQVSLPDVTT
jgi:hypothetical protein